MSAAIDTPSLPSTLTLGAHSGLRIGYGAMRITGPGNYGPPANRAAAIEVVRAAVDLGVTFFDTADAYGPGVSEEILAEALAPVRDRVLIATKGGAIKSAPGKVHFDGSPRHLRDALEGSLRRLRTERIDLYFLHRPDPKVAFERSVETLAELRDQGKIDRIGLSNVSMQQLEAALEITEVAAVQNVYSLMRREHEGLLELAQDRGIVFMAYAPLAAPAFEPRSPLADPSGPLGEVASELGVAPAQVALSWLLHRSPVLLPIPGTTRRRHLESNVAAASIHLTRHHIRRIEDAVR